MILRKETTKDANDTKRDYKTSQEKWFCKNQSEWFSCENEKQRDRNNGYCSLSLQDSQKRYGASNIKTGWFTIIQALGGMMMNKLFYPAIFHKAEEGGYWITFPDIPECMTQGEDMQHAYEMAIEALGLAITSRETDNVEIPIATEPCDIELSKDEFCVVIEFDMLAYKKRTNSKAVKKTLSIPEWLNEEATSLGINFSQVLQEALMQKIGVR